MFENFGKKIADIGNSVAAEASNMMDSTKSRISNFSEVMSLKNKIENAKKEISNIYTSIGERYFAENRSNIPEGYEELFAKIEENERSIAQAEEELRALSEEKTCPNCGASVKKEFDYCTVCGQRVKEVGSQIECSNCHTINGGDALFCIGCGSKLEKPVEPEKVAQKICPNCGNKAQVNAAFCNMCGSSLK